MTPSRQSASEGKKLVRRGSATERTLSGRPLARMSSAKLMGMPPVSYYIATVGHRQECLGCEECSMRPCSGQDGLAQLRFSRFLSGMMRLYYHETVTGGTTHGWWVVYLLVA